MTTPSGLTEKRKLESVTSDDYSLQDGPNQKLIKRSSTERVSDIFFQKPSPTSERDDDEDDDDDDDNDDDFSEMNDFLHKEDPSNHSHQQGQRPDQQQQKGQEQLQPQPQLPPQRKKPGRKPNPASPALRKAQNRAAQRAFRERKERHLRDLEDTIKDLRERAEKYHSLIAHLESENSYWKKVAFYFECALNKNNGNNDATTKLKNFLALTLPSRSTAPFLFNGGRAAVGQINPSFGLEAMQMRQPSLPSHQVPTAQQLQNNCLDLLQTSMGVSCDALSIINVPSPTSSNVLMPSPSGSTTISTASVSSASSPLTPESVIAESISPSSTFLVEEFAREMTIADMKPFINPTPSIQISHEPSYVSSNVYNSSIASMYKAAIRSSSSSKSNSTSSTVSTASSSSDDAIASTNPSSFVDETAYNNSNDMFLDFLDDQGFEEFSNFDFDGSDVISNITEKGLSKEEQQVLRLSKKMGQSVVGPVYPKVKHPLTEEQLYYLSLGHDRRIDMIPCLHLRSRMIQYHDQYDLDELIELLIEHAKCHGDPLDPDSWELPDEFFDRYDLLVFQQCRIKSNLYKQFGHLPKDFLIT